MVTPRIKTVWGWGVRTSKQFFVSGAEVVIYVWLTYSESDFLPDTNSDIYSSSQALSIAAAIYVILLQTNVLRWDKFD